MLNKFVKRYTFGQGSYFVENKVLTCSFQGDAYYQLNTMGSRCYCHFSYLIVLVYIFSFRTGYQFVTIG